MNTKTGLLAGAILLTSLGLGGTSIFAATNEISHNLQQGLFEEEANHNYPVAIKAYESVISQSDSNRPLAATAIFRLGEIYRRQGKTNEASAQYERIVREFPDQEELAKLSREHLPPTASGSSENAGSELRTLDAEIASLKKVTPAQRRVLVEYRHPTPMLTDLMQLLAHYQKASSEDPSSDQSKALTESVTKQVDEQVDSVIQGLKLRREALAAAEAASGSPGGSSLNATETVSLELRTLENKITALKKLNQADQRILVQQQYPNPVLTSLMQQKSETEQKLTELNKEFGAEYPEVLKAEAKLRTINKQVDDQVAAVLRGLELRRDSLAASVSAAGSQTSPKNSGDLNGTETEETKRIHDLIKNSPDLINAPQSDQRTLLQAAAGKGELEVVKLLLENGAAVNGLRQGDLTALHYAAGNGHKAIVDFLLAHGAKPNAETGSGVTPLDLALCKGYEAVAKALLAAGASVKTKIKSNVDYSGDLNYSFKAGQTPLHIIARSGYPGFIPELLKQGLDLNAQDAGGRTALSYAVEKKNEPVVRALLAAGADVNLGSSPPLHLACMHDFQGLAEVLLAKGANPNLEAYLEPSGVYSPLEIAVMTKHPEILELLLKNKGNPNLTIRGTPLIFNAIAEPGLLRLLLESGAKADVRDGRGASPLDEAAWKNNLLAAELLIAHGSPTTPSLFSAVRESTTNMVELLLKNRANVNARDSYEDTPLHLAVRGLSVPKTKILLEHQADPNLRNIAGSTALDLAKAMLFGSQTGRPGFIPATRSSEDVRSAAGELVKLLREHGARDDLPHLDRIEVTRPSSGYSNFEFTKGTNDWNRFSLLEALACEYRLITTQPSGGVASRRGGGNSIWSGNLNFPDLENLIIHRPSPDGKGWSAIRVNALELLATGDCARDGWLQWGDVVEVPETDHPISERWQGMPDGTVSNLLQCVSRQITVRQKGSENAIKLIPEYRHSHDLVDPNYAYTVLPASFMLRSVLDQMKLIRFSSDLTRVKITRRDAKTGKSQEWIVDCSSSDHSPAFWLRDGDVVEIPDK